MKRTVLLVMLCAVLVTALAGCSSSADPAPSVSPGMNTPDTSPMLSPNVPQATDGGLLGDLGEIGKDIGDTLTGQDNAELATAEDALTASKELRDAVQKLTEVDTAVAVAAGNTVLVGVTFDTSYQGGVNDRLRAMVLDRAKAIHPSLTAVAVTDDEAKVDEIASLYQMLQSGSPYTTVKANADTLADGLTLYKE